ncbi:MAG TPA: DUF2283 domain-containing protein [Candidatus Kapabacteria bacterium]|nr:DUF2283 domain-containing protein [Candidatus Kapabacteria bacterium]
MGEKKEITVWYDREGDYLEVVFDDDSQCTFRNTDNDAVMEMVNDDGKIIGFSIMAVSKLSAEKPISAHLYGLAA